MTGLEDLWKNLPVRPAPVDDIVRAGRDRTGRAERPLRRPLIASGVALAVAASFVAGTLVGNDLPRASLPFPDASPAAFQADLKPAASCSALLTSYRERALPLVTSYGWGRQQILIDGPVAVANGDFRYFNDAIAFRPGVTEARVTEQSSSETGTNVQEADVDEPDLVKTNGTLAVRLRGTDLQVWNLRGKQPRKEGSIRLTRVADASILLDGDDVVVVGTDQASRPSELDGRPVGTRVISVSIDDPDRPRVTSTVTFSARVLEARKIDSNVHLVLSSSLPDLDFVQPGGRMTEQAALTRNRALVRASTIDDWLPSMRSGGERRRLVECDNVAIPPDTPGLGTVSVVGFRADQPTKVAAAALAAPTTITYASANHLVLASSPATWGCGRGVWFGRPCAPDDAQGSGTSKLYDFRLDGTAAIHEASGEVEGTIADRWSLDEAKGVLRVAVGPSSETGNFNSVVTLRRDGQQLAEVGRVSRLGVGEEIKSVRWFDDVAFVVTFETTDPVYSIDLSHPTRPRLAGELKLPGFSEYLHPIGRDQLLGVGARDDGAQVVLFDASDLARVRAVDTVRMGNAYALAGRDPRSFTWLPKRRTALAVMQRDADGYVAEVSVRGNRLANRLQHVEYGDDIRDVRTFALADGRIVLVTGEDLRFLKLTDR